MTNETDRIQNAINHIKSSMDIDPWAMEIAVEAMEKQIQTKPGRIDKNDTFDGNWEKVCARCGFVFVERVTTPEMSYPKICRQLPYCVCGQAIDWSDNE